METNQQTSSWIEANQAHLSAKFADLKRRLSRGAQSPLADEELPLPELDSPPAIDELTRLFGLSSFERELLLLCAGVEMDSGLATICQNAGGNPRRAQVTFGLALGSLCEPHWSALTPVRPLRRFRLLELDAGAGLTTTPLRIDERILHYLAGVNLLDQRLASLLKASPFPQWIAPAHEAVALRIATALDVPSQLPIIHLSGDDPHGQEDAGVVAAHELGRRLFVVSAEDLPTIGPELDQFNTLWQREGLLVPGALLIQCSPAGFGAAARYLVDRVPGVLMLASREPFRLNRPFLRFQVDKPAPAEQKRIWQKELGPAAADFNGTLDALAEQFRLSARTIYTTAEAISANEATAAPADLWNACRSNARPKLEDLAQRIVPAAGWADLILPDQQMETLRQLVAQVRNRLKVFETWGFSAKGRRGLGVSALFCGESGTGKTLAAEVLAKELELDLYRIDLSAVVSKYIGETEKNLRQVFDAAEEGGSLLLFDEAEALFGKRGEVRHSHDRHANIEVSYLLQRMEAFGGMAILTTNMKSTMDKAFHRRLRFTVNFPFPDAKHRQAIWESSFPPAAPMVDIDVRKLAQLNVAGGNIRNIALNAAFLAADCDQPLRMGHLLRAAQLEGQKIDRPVSEAEIRGWV